FIVWLSHSARLRLRLSRASRHRLPLHAIIYLRDRKANALPYLDPQIVLQRQAFRHVASPLEGKQTWARSYTSRPVGLGVSKAGLIPSSASPNSKRTAPGQKATFAKFSIGWPRSMTRRCGM